MRSLFGRIEDGEKWVPDEKAIFSAGLVALILSIGVAALLSLFR